MVESHPNGYIIVTVFFCYAVSTSMLFILCVQLFSHLTYKPDSCQQQISIALYVLKVVEKN